ncbi:hypothetical protein [Bradyrhizobium sp. STM 3562]|uniref:hypothetical protein n=1 Tax=Bradyrhizobium sp. STM 3562 TaxID=578924 RepID=UPI00388D9AE9
MADILLSPEAAKFISGFVAGAAVCIFALRFGLADKTRQFLMNKMKSFVHLH